MATLFTLFEIPDYVRNFDQNIGTRGAHVNACDSFGSG